MTNIILSFGQNHLSWFKNVCWFKKQFVQSTNKLCKITKNMLIPVMNLEQQKLFCHFHKSVCAVQARFLTCACAYNSTCIHWTDLYCMGSYGKTSSLKTLALVWTGTVFSRAGEAGNTFHCMRKAHNPHSEVVIVVKLDHHDCVIGHKALIAWLLFYQPCWTTASLWESQEQ